MNVCSFAPYKSTFLILVKLLFYFGLLAFIEIGKASEVQRVRQQKREREGNKWNKRGHRLESNLSHQQGRGLCRQDPGRTRWAIRLHRIFSHNTLFNIRQVHLMLYLATFLLVSSCHCYDNISFVADPAFSRSPSTIYSNHCLHLSFI